MIFLPAWSGQSAAELFALEATHRIDSLVLAFEHALQEKERNKSLTEPERDVLAIEALEREVNNGGYSQFFLNTPEYAAMIVGALQRIGCERTAFITERAIEALGPAARLSPEAVEARVADADEIRRHTWSTCDAEYYDAGEDIAGRLFAYLKQQRALVLLR